MAPVLTMKRSLKTTAQLWAALSIGGSLLAIFTLWVISIAVGVLFQTPLWEGGDIGWAWWIHPIGLAFALLWPPIWVTFCLAPALLTTLHATSRQAEALSQPFYVVTCALAGAVSGAAFYLVDWHLSDLAGAHLRSDMRAAAVAFVVGGCAAFVCALLRLMLRSLRAKPEPLSPL